MGFVVDRSLDPKQETACVIRIGRDGSIRRTRFRLTIQCVKSSGEREDLVVQRNMLLPVDDSFIVLGQFLLVRQEITFEIKDTGFRSTGLVILSNHVSTKILKLC